MPRNARFVLPGQPYHVTQRGNNRQDVFYSVQDRELYLDLVKQNLADAGVRAIAYCLMTNHVHWIVVPEHGDSLAVLFRRVHGRYAQYLNVRRHACGHLWQARYFSCVLSPRHLDIALRYVERNPVRAAMIGAPEDCRWSSAALHTTAQSATGKDNWLDLSHWRQLGGASGWRQMLKPADSVPLTNLFRRCTFAERPFGDERFVQEIEQKANRIWRRFTYDAELNTASLAVSLSALSAQVGPSKRQTGFNPTGTERSVPARRGAVGT